MKPPVPSSLLPWLLLGAFVLASVSGCRRGSSTAEALRLSGNVEAVDAQLAFKHPGRMARRAVSEGDRLQSGALVAQLDDREQRAELALREAEHAAAAAALAELEAGSRPQEIAAAAATVRRTRAAREQARLELDRTQELFDHQVISDRELEAARAAFEVADALEREAIERLRLAEEGPRPEAIQQARARLAQAQAGVDLARTRLEDTSLAAPFGAVVLAHHLEPGEVAAAGAPVVTVADLARVWVRVYLNETDLGRIRHGQAVEVRTDTYPDKPYSGTVSFIAAEAEFTPRAVQTHQERVKLVYRLKVDVANPAGELKPGMPADVLIPPP